MQTQEVKAVLNNIAISPQKVRLVANEIRNIPVEKALNFLIYTNKKAAGIVKKVLESAIANAENNNGLDIDELNVSSIYVNQGPTLKRFQARAKGRGNRIIKRSSHITVIISKRDK